MMSPVDCAVRGHDFRLTEHGYVRTWRTEIDVDEAGVTTITAHSSGSSDWGDDGDCIYKLECRYCGAEQPMPLNYQIEWD